MDVLPNNWLPRFFGLPAESRARAPIVMAVQGVTFTVRVAASRQLRRNLHERSRTLTSEDATGHGVASY